MHFQLFSDLHLEYKEGYPRIPPQAPYLILAGDIGHIDDNNYKQFISYCSTHWDSVIIVLGNHEFYHNKKTKSELLHEYRCFFSLFDNIYLLEKTKIQLEDFEIIGCTMWSFIEAEYLNMVNCVHKIQYTSTIQSIDERMESNNLLFEECKNWLVTNYNPNKKTIIITHHPITQENVRQDRWKHEPKELLSSFCCDLDLSTNTQCICISGHTHYSHDFVRNNVRYISNQMGYNKEYQENHTKYNENGIYCVK